MTKKDRKDYDALIKRARTGLRALRANRPFWSNAQKARQLTAINANIWLAIGILRHTETYNKHGVRV